MVPLLAGVLGASAVACGAQNDDGTAGDGERGLTAALSAVPASSAELPLTYRDVRTARRLVATGASLYRGLDGYGVWELSGRPESRATFRTRYGFDAKNIETSLLLGSQQSQRLTGTFDVDAARAALTKRGYKASDEGGDGVRLSKDGQASFAVSASARVTDWLDGATLPLEAPSDAVTDDSAYRAVLDCLGDDVYEASLYGKRPEYRERGITLVGVAGRVDGTKNPTETLCALTPSKAAAERAAGKLRGKTGAGERYAGSKVTVGEGETPVVSLTWKNATKSGLRPTDQERTGELLRLLLS
ncbi:hypothetical protein V2W30_25685 [Streptomyces sp. Q6]|uniref:Uncharacterized protein n=1 Tax=Streptomyces citrinus TaxID=3118173 RepID=A0ACD5AGP2_9ACTN